MLRFLLSLSSAILILLFIFTIPAGMADTGVAAPRFPASLDGLEPSDKRPAVVEGGFTVDPTVRETARLFYNTVYMSSAGVPSGWNGDVTACNAGSTSSDYQAAIRRRVNWFRAMAGIPANIVFDSGFSAKAQQAALMMSANKSLSHTPPASWACYTADGAQAAGNSDLALGSAGFDAIDGYIEDPGSSNYVVGHRRWILYPQTQTMGTGDVVPASGSPRANALWVFDNHVRDTRPTVRDDFIAWPPQGYVPYQTVYPRWSLSYPAADFSGASVTMSLNGRPISVTKESYVTGYGENTLVWIPSPYTDSQDWAKPTADETYQVTVSNVRASGQSRTFAYTATVFDPAVKGADYVPQQITGSSNITTGQPTTYTFSAIPIANSYQWRQGSAADYTTINGAESGLGDFVAAVSSSYSPISTGRPATGNAAYHLAHPQPVDQALTLNKTLFIGPAGSLQFSSYLGLATPNQYAIVEASEDGGQSWTVLYQQAGNNASENSYSPKVASLAGFAGKTISLRFRYRFAGGSYYPQTADNVGWFFDDVQIIDGDTTSFSAPLATDTSSTFIFTGASAGRYLLQVQPLLFGDFPGEWSAAKTVDVTGAIKYTLMVAKIGTGTGAISGGGNYAAGASVKLTATPDAGSTFADWSPSPCAANFIMPANNLTCTATFTATTPGTYTLTVDQAGTGSGIVNGDGNYAAGASVKLTATPDAGSTFAGWSPSPCAAAFTMPPNNLTCTAKFTNGSILPGDVNEDGSVNALDVVAVINAVLGIQPLPAADVNDDGNINALDVVFVINKVLGI